MDKFDLIVIGSGPGGYVSAIYAAKHGMKTAIIEAKELGGTCLNKGCIPTKTLLKSSHLYYECKQANDFGIHIQDVTFSMNEIIDRKDRIVSSIRDGIKGLLTGNGVTIINGYGTIYDKGKVKLEDGSIITGDRILIATGAKPNKPNIPGIHSNFVLTSDELLESKEFYQNLVILGGGVIACEFATIYQELGSNVTIIEYMDRILPSMEREISTTLSMNLKKKGVTIIPKAKVTNIEDEKDLIKVTYEIGDESKVVIGDRLLVAAGRKGNTKRLFENIDIQMDGDKILVNERFESSIEGIYAIGDIIRGQELAHMASAQGMVAVEYMLLKEPSIDLTVIPACIYTSPEIATVGLSKDNAKKRGFDVKVLKYPLSGNCKSVLSADERGYIKLIVEGNTEIVIGAEIICSRATDMISELATAIVNKLELKDVLKVIRPHPTYSEGITEAASDFYKMSIHMLPTK